ncbi:hypothetical protein BO82DRAFT_404453 [Aspergillus uvarum CBS 121591]|uniref:Uncharacterized protein n=1 Tax=Aspergillus uvarum CBS 121591 TaxID=1448315 RepID=A0A319DI66_9EURO|nr:hypothetical protein BO82DRAFT_404453 [Aspergillus uvarum CBS 121591]PYH79212.1 hypothetical protein BO82DRAFT_404453 [Aspergillus uvarum CBS 121591]
MATVRMTRRRGSLSFNEPNTLALLGVCLLFGQFLMGLITAIDWYLVYITSALQGIFYFDIYLVIVPICFKWKTIAEIEGDHIEDVTHVEESSKSTQLIEPAELESQSDPRLNEAHSSMLYEADSRQLVEADAQAGYKNPQSAQGASKAEHPLMYELNATPRP